MPQPKEEGGGEPQAAQTPTPASLKQQLYPAPRQSAAAPAPKHVVQEGLKRSTSPHRRASPSGRLGLGSTAKLLRPLQGWGANVGAAAVPAAAQTLGNVKLPDTPVSPRASLSPLALRPGLAGVPALRGAGNTAAANKQQLNIDVAPSDGGRAGLTSPQLKSAGGPRPGTAHRDSCLVLPSSPMAPAAAGRPASPAAWQIHSTLSTPVPTRTASPGPPEAAATEPVHAASLLAQPAQTGAVVGAASLSKAVSSAGVDEYNYIKLIFTLREYPTTEDFVYLRRFQRWPADCNPYALEVVQFADIDQSNYYTMSVRGITHYIDGVNAEFASLDQWEQEVKLYISLKQLRLFRQHKLWKAFKCWKSAIDSAKLAAARAALNKQLFLLSPVFQQPLQQFYGLCHEISSMRLHRIVPGQVYSLESFASQHAEQVQQCAQRLAVFSQAAFEVVQAACRDDLVHLQQQLETFNAKADITTITTTTSSSAASASISTLPLSPGGGTGSSSHKSISELLKSRSSMARHKVSTFPAGSSSTSADGKAPQQEYAYTMAAAYRSEQRRLLSFLRMTDAMMCDTLQTILVQSVTDMLEALEPASYSNAPADQRLLDGEGEWPASSSSSGGRSLQAMASMLNGSRRQRAAAAVACMQLSPVAARQQQPAEAAAAGAGAAAGPRPPLLELHVLMSSGCEELSFAPEPEQFQSQLSTVLNNFISCVTGITRLLRPELVSGLLGAKQSDVQDATPLADLVVPPECTELVHAAKAALEVALVRATQQRTAYEPYREMARYDCTLDLASLAPAYKATCAMTAKAMAAPPSAAAEPSLLGLVGSTACVSTISLPAGAERSFVEGHVTLATFKQLLDRLQQQKAAIEDLLPASSIDIMRLDVAALRQALIPWPVRRLSELHEVLPVLAADMLHDFITSVQSSQSKLGALCTCVEDFVEKMLFLDDHLGNEKAMDHACSQVHALYALLDEYRVKVPDVDRAGYATMDSSYAALKALVEDVEGNKDASISKYSAELEAGAEAVAKEVAVLRSAAQSEMFLDEESSPAAVTDELHHLIIQLKSQQDDLARINKYQRLFKVAESRLDEVAAVQEDLELKLLLWNNQAEFEQLAATWRSVQFDGLDVAAMEEVVAQFHKAVSCMERGLPPNRLVPKLRAAVDEYRLLLPVVAAMRNTALKDRHWAKVFASISTVLPRDETFTLQVLLDAKVGAVKDAIIATSTEATQEASLEELLAKVVAKWATIELSVVPYKDSKDVYILGSIDTIQVALEDSLVTMSTILASRFVAGIRVEVEKVQRQLTSFSDTLEQWVQVQKSWMYLEPIFSAQDIQKQLPAEHKAFDQVHRQLRDIMRRTKDRPNALQITSNAGLLETLTKSFDTLEAIQKSLEEYLETKRVAFPRFYFLSNDELLEILAQAKNAQAVQPHMGKCFDGIKRLDFGDDPKSTEIYAMVSGEGERVSFGKNTVKARNTVESWLGMVESAMVSSLRRLAKQGMASYVEEPRADWVLQQPAQLVIAVSQVCWCGSVEEALKSPAPVQKLAELHEVSVQQVSELTRLVRGDVSGLARRLLAALITIDVHSRDIVINLLSKGTCSTQDFEWQMQLRYYWEEDDLVVRQVQARFAYAYEYLGVQPRLVVTPMTDRCYLTLTRALHLKLGGAPAGPAGTGKTETTKDLGRALGVNCVVFNCGENLDYKFMGKFFSGLASCGGWGVFDEFNRINLEVLSVVAQQLLAIQNALRASMDKFWFEGRPIRLQQTCGVFITMNPGYAGRTELPDNLKALFRPMAMMIPDYALVAEVMLFSEGFEDSKVLSRKMVQLYKLASEQLSQQDFYDFGMRALKSVLVMAGSLKRANPTLPEDIVLIRAMRDSSIPKFLNPDVELFQNIIGDLFPGVDVPDQDYGELELSLRAVLSQRGLQQAPGFLKKAVQVWETMCVRFGVMLVGPSGGGKTTCCSVLQSALTRLRQELNHPNEQFQVTNSFTLNPKSISMGELYGDYNLLTNEWADGLASSIIRAAVSDTTLDRKWVVFDGPVDPLWIENMNTVLDDNCTLCLPNGERIKLNPLTMRMVFEVQDLAMASPATVSRCGMIYIASEEVGWRPTVQTWLTTALPKVAPALGQEQQGVIYSLFDAHVDAGLAWVHKQDSSYIPAVDSNMVTSLALIMQSLLDPAKGFKSADVPAEAFAQAANRIFAFAYVWALGGNLAPASRPGFDEHAREQLQDVCSFPGGGLVYDYQLVHTAGKPEFRPFSDAVPAFSYNKHTPFFQMVVPTADTARFSYLLETCLDVGRSVLFVGLTGVGKSVITRSALQALAGSVADAQAQADYSSSGRVAGRLAAHTLVFSAQTSSSDVQCFIESKLDKKRKKRYGAPPHMKVVFFIDDVNMPAREPYGAQPPIELLRQFQDYRGMYDRKQLFWRDIEDVTLCAACGPPGGGRQEVTTRFFRHFTMLAVPPPSDSAIKTILSSIITGFLADFNPEVRSLSGPVVLASVDAYNRISEEFLPTPAKSTYTFNLRDLSKQFQGVLMATPSSCSSKDAFARLWLHEACRVFADRLVCEEDLQQLHQILVEVANKHNLGSLSYDEAFKQRNIAWASFLRPGVDREQRRCEEVSDWAKVQKLLKDYLDDYNSSHNTSTDLVFFQSAVDHVCRMCRVFQQPRGNAMLVGVGGSGKQSLTRLAAHISGCKVFQIELSRAYGAAEFRADLVKLYRMAGVDNEQVVFLFSDTQILHESFLEDINNMLNSGEVHGVFAQNELEQVVRDVREWVEASGVNPTREACYAAFIDRVRDNLHIALTMSPVGDAFRSRCRQFPSLVNCCTIDWFSDWPDEALLSVSTKFLGGSDLGSEAITAAVAHMCLHIHRTVEAASAKFYNELRRKFYTTPKSYLDLIDLYVKLLQERKSNLQHSCDRLLDGVRKLTETEALVSSMKVDLARLQPVLEAKAAATAELLAKVSTDQQEAEKVKVVVAAEEQEIGVMQQRTQAIAQEAKADLAEAMPALQAAIDSLKALNKNDIVEIKSFTKPPALVQMTMEAVCILKQEKADWDAAKRVLSDTNFMRSLEEFDKDNIPDTVIHKLKKYIEDPQYQPDVVAKQSRAAMSLCMWTRAMDVYNRVSKVVEPKRKKLAEAEAQLQAANAQLKEKQDALAAVVHRVNDLKRQLADAESEQRQLHAQADLTRKRLDRAGKLTSGLSEEGVRWRATAEQLQAQIGLLVGDVFISAACISYYGAFTGSYREQLVQGWVAKCKEVGIPVSETVTVCGTLANPVEANPVREWMLAGLPSDGTSIDNGILVTRGRRWPLMIDPQGQASSWIKALEGRNGLKVVKLSDPAFLRILENCIRIGSPCLIEDVGEALDPALERVLQRRTFKQGGRLLIRVGDADVDYDPSFKLYITTKLANPHYFPETCINVTLVNFTVTMQGLEDQLLADVVQQERPELEEQRDRLIVSIAADKRQLQELEDKILKLLRESEGNILDDEQLINTLNNSKRTSAAIQMRVKEAEETERHINTARERYRPAATRGSIIYFTIADLAGINPMYEFSLAYFARMFSQCISASSKSDDVDTRLQLLSDFTTSFVFKSVSRGLFEEHKRLFGFLLCTSIMRHPSNGGISETEWSCLIRGPITTLACQHGVTSSQTDTSQPSQLQWLPDKDWAGLQALEQCLPELQGLTDSWQKQAAEWQSWYTASEPHSHPLPDPWQQRLDHSFKQLLLVHLLRPEWFVPAAHSYVSGHLGEAFIEPEPWTLDEVFAETSCNAPVIFILSTGADLTSMLQRFGDRKGWLLGQRLHVVSLGQGQGLLAETMIKQAAAAGEWVCLQNCHLAASWMRRLEEKVEELAHGMIGSQAVHPDFRLWLTSMPSPVFPVPVLQNGIKLTNEPPKGVKANLARSYNQLSDGVLDSCPLRPNEWRRLLFSLTMFHAVVQERRKFGSLGWNIRYEFNTSDLECSSSTLHMFLSSQDAIPWQALEYVIGQVNYGGRVTDDLDRRCLMSILRQFICPHVVRQEGAALTASAAYCVPKDGGIESYLDSIRALPSTEPPEVFGMHPNANIAFQLQETSSLLDAVISIQPRISSSTRADAGAGAGGAGAIVAALCDSILQQMPPDLSMDEAAAGLFDRRAAPLGDGGGGGNKQDSLCVVLGQEVERFRRLSAVMRASLAQMQAAIKGLVVMSETLEASYNSLLQHQVPEEWARVGYPSLKPLGAWIKDYTARIAFMRTWLQRGHPACFWLPGFFFPQGFLTGMLQMHARKYAVPIDSLSYSFKVTDALSAADVSSPPEDGMYVDGLWLEGARWDAAAGCLADSQPGVMAAPLPVVHFKPVAHYQPPAAEYQCPLYKTSARAGALSTTGCSTNFVLCVSLPCPTRRDVDAWVLQGVALLCQLDS